MATPAAASSGAAPEIDVRVGRAVVSAFTWTVGLAGVVWAAIYLVLDLPGAAAYPAGFSLVSVLNGLAYRRLRRFELFAAVEVTAVLVVPAALAIHLGGLMASGAVAVWSFLAPVGALMAIGLRAGILAFGGFTMLIALAVWSDFAGRGAALSGLRRRTSFSS